LSGCIEEYPVEDEDYEESFQDIKAYDNYAQYGGVMYLVDKTNVTFKNSQFQRNYASQNGGTISIVREVSSKSYVAKVSLIESEITDSTAVNNGGVISLGHDRMILNI
jgi:hypothetical protein